ncbi:helix-turn-helix transcriptional regulator [Novosphingobium mangrovi (ex Huang et al. 2023)]|uniref:Helix-turn-helix transcriptional regulator n=1 Tax=Novosphingobium mangrovi (ex Huang et al. 2023) TaxID=2976432 RepID=A0ABT2I8J0_9SPHN|nr:helix-turn-helix transcriptional regulator [Novosphingobium mangrovi (ex Huang et al. 2023)]MCT2401089.1 helix-turn-helix transcriptional regulator [Novosphingobium mangrovi (ex Huang et al. 2023)]
MLTGEDADALLAPLIEGLLEDPPWRAFLDALRERVGGDYASLVFRPLPFGTPQARVIHLYSGQPFPPDVARHHRENLNRMDPMPHHDMSEGRTYRLGELLQSDDPDHETYLAELLVPAGMNHLRMIRFTERGGVSGWITVTRRAGDFAPDIDVLLEDLAPHMRAALAGFVALERERMTAAVAREAVRRMNFGWLTLDGEGRLLDADAHGAQMLAGAGHLSRSKDGRLTARDPQLRRQLLDAIRELAGNPQARPRALVLSREPWLDLLFVPSSPRLDMTPVSTQAAPAIVCYLHADNWSSADRCEQLAQLFDLAPSEARLALALSRGMSISEAAPELGLTVESARTYSKRIYAKTGARGQADLVRFIHRSVLVIA